MISLLIPILPIIVKDLFILHNEFSFSGNLSLASELCSGLELKYIKSQLGNKSWFVQNCKEIQLAGG